MPPFKINFTQKYKLYVQQKFPSVSNPNTLEINPKNSQHFHAKEDMRGCHV